MIVYEYVYRFAVYVYGFILPNTGAQPRGVVRRVGCSGLLGGPARKSSARKRISTSRRWRMSAFS